LLAVGMTDAQPGSEPKATKKSPAEWVAVLKKEKNEPEREAARKALRSRAKISYRMLRLFLGWIS
jgi:hypothetical protein